MTLKHKNPGDYSYYIERWARMERQPTGMNPREDINNTRGKKIVSQWRWFLTSIIKKQEWKCRNVCDCVDKVQQYTSWFLDLSQYLDLEQSDRRGRLCKTMVSICYEDFPVHRQSYLRSFTQVTVQQKKGKCSDILRTIGYSWVDTDAQRPEVSPS